MAEEKKVVAPEPTVDRETAYQNYLKQIGDTDTTEQVTAPVEAEKKPEEKPVEGKKETPAESEVKPEEKKEEKFVPYDALHSERIKRKAEAEAKRAAEARAEALETELARLKNQGEPETITDYDREIIETKRRLKAIENLEAQRVEREKRESADRMQNQIQGNVQQADKDLESEGFPGFADMIGSVTRELQRLVDEDESNAALDNPAGWKKIYKEKVFPSVAAKFEKVLKNQTIEDKIALKKEANLVTSTGKANPKPKNADDLSEDEMRKNYIEMRRNRTY